MKDGEEKLKKDVADSEKKINQYKMVLVKGQNKIKDQQGQIEKLGKQIEKLGKDNQELKDKSSAGGPSKGIYFAICFLIYSKSFGFHSKLNFMVMSISEESDLRFNSLKSQFDATRSRLEKELAEAKKENAELQQKVSFALCKLKAIFGMSDVLFTNWD